MRQLLVVGNWKMNGSRASVRALLSDLVNATSVIGPDVTRSKAVPEGAAARAGSWVIRRPCPMAAAWGAGSSSARGRIKRPQIPSRGARSWRWTRWSEFETRDGFMYDEGI